MYRFIIILLVFVFAKESNGNTADIPTEDWRPPLGYPRGYLTICPGTTKPLSINRSQLKFIGFYIQRNGLKTKYTYWNAKNIIKDPLFNRKRKTMIIVAGYMDHGTGVIGTMFANTYEDMGYNIIIIDYQRFSTLHIFLTTRLTRPLGLHIAEVLAQLTDQGLKPENMEFFGYSLGGQIVSYMAKNYQKITGKTISVIYGIEPSGPCFRALGPEHRLNASDADFVLVVHTNIDVYGNANQLGDIDFYINGGEFQADRADMYPCSSVCSHFRVLALWLQALKNPYKFIGMQCDSIQQARDFDCYNRVPRVTNVLGPKADRSKPGIFFVSTSSYFPYYLGEDGLKPEFASWRQISNVNEGNETEIIIR